LSSTEEIDFSRSKEAANKINQFVNEQTNGLIREIIKPESLISSTGLLLLSAIYFKGAWKYTFDPENTIDLVFHVDKSRQTDSSAMSTSGSFKVSSMDSLKSEILEIPYSDGQTSMVIVLPNEETDIRHVEGLLGDTGIESLIEGFNGMSATPDVLVVLPSFITEFEVDKLEEALMRLKVETIFDDTRCNLTEITDSKTFIQKIVHKAAIVVNEEGSEAAAATAVLGGTKSSLSGPIPRKFIVDKLPLFAGRIVDPNGSLLLRPLDS